MSARGRSFSFGAQGAREEGRAMAEFVLECLWFACELVWEVGVDILELWGSAGERDRD
jgi:hypothetical protein